VHTVFAEVHMLCCMQAYEFYYMQVLIMA